MEAPAIKEDMTAVYLKRLNVLNHVPKKDVGALQINVINFV